MFSLKDSRGRESVTLMFVALSWWSVWLKFVQDAVMPRSTMQPERRAWALSYAMLGTEPAADNHNTNEPATAKGMACRTRQTQ